MLKSIVHIRAERGLKYLLYSCTYEEYTPYKMLDFLKPSYLKTDLKNKTAKIRIKGHSTRKKRKYYKNISTTYA